MIEVNKIFINGQFITPAGNETQDLYNPSTASIIGQVRLGNAEDMDNAVSAAKAAYRTYSKFSTTERGEVLEKLYHAVLKNDEKLIILLRY